MRYHIIMLFLDNGNLAVDHFQHLSMLSYSLFVLSQDSVSPDDLDVVANYLRRFLLYFERQFGPENMRFNVHMLQHARRFLLYFERQFGPENMRFNVHMLQHAVDSRRCLGPAWTISTFNFESWNRKLGLCVTSANGVMDQILIRHLMRSYVHAAVQSDDVAADVRRFVSHVRFSTPRKIAVEVDNNTVVLGKAVQRQEHNNRHDYLPQITSTGGI